MKVPQNPVRKITAIINELTGYIGQLGAFGVASIEYTFHKIDQLIWLLQKITIKNFEFWVNLKFVAISRLIWSRGRIAGRVKYLFIITFAWVLFLSAGVFQGSLVKQEPEQKYAFIGSSKSILIEKATAATQTGNTNLFDGPIEHTVKEGETLIEIGEKYGISFESIKFANNLYSNYVKAGQVIIIPQVEGTIHKVKTGDTLEKLARKYNVPTQSIVDFNYIDAPYTLTPGQVITIPDAKLPDVGKYYAGSLVYDTSAYGLIPYSGTGTTGSGVFLWPFSGIISQGFHRYHPAIDIAGNSGNIISADKGTVVRAGWWQGGYGNAVQIDHGNGYVTTYAHMSTIFVSSGQEVDKGQAIGVVGSTGRSTGPHVHFTIQLNGKYINPLSVL